MSIYLIIKKNITSPNVMETVIDILKDVVTIVVPLITIYFLGRGLKNWRTDKSKELYNGLQVTKENLLKKIGKEISKSARNDAMGEFIESEAN